MVQLPRPCLPVWGKVEEVNMYLPVKGEIRIVLVDLQYKIESREQVEQYFVHIYYEKREYDEHIVITVNGYKRIQLG
eukprot:CAMPEP_0194419144 /NCGR_PEP_ID=MMETSP0176-20130528/18403_1 /TAXON_ID=216777 /ORGANISM="Proboscia alata, Strain PI-D3" /LENGTH=76 /DNA_ID=CAMNT_0039226051 /DNA_START=55 /DNA_END=285 /DNA_ORIENTATION=-